MHCRVSSHYPGVLDPDIAAFRVGDHTPRFPDQQATCGNVPGGEVLFPEAIESAGSNIRQIEGGCTRAANSASAGCNPGKLPLILVQTGEVAKRKPGSDERILGIVDPGNLEPAVSDPGASIPGCMIGLIARYVVYYRGLQHTVNGSSNGNSVAGIAVQKVCGSVQGIYYPHQAFGDDVRAELLANDAGTFAAVLEHVPDDALRSPIDLGNEVAPSLQRPPGWALGSLNAPEVACGQFSRGPGSA
jgi:hypothetical protein